MSKLVCRQGSNEGDEFPVGEGTTLIGRTGECNITLFDRKCSRAQCEIHKKGGYYSIDDLESRNGTFVNGKRLHKAQSLRVGDQIRIGATVLELSDKPIGDLVTQTATDVAAELQGHHKFGDLIGNASAEASRLQEFHEQRAFAPVRSFFKSIFGK